MHVLDIIFIYGIIQIVGGKDHKCFMPYGLFIENSVTKSEYEYHSIDFKRFIKSSCRRGKLTMIWTKNGVEIDRRKYPKNRMGVQLKLKFYSLSKSDTGVYTLHMYNNVIDYKFNVTVTVTDGSPQKRALRDQMVPENSSHLTHARLYWMPKMIEVMETSSYSIYSNSSISCFYFSTTKAEHKSTRWLHRRGPGLRFVTNGDYGYEIEGNSRLVKSVTEYDCTNDEWMPKHQGYCYSSKLHFIPFLPGDDGLYSCQVNKNLTASFVVQQKFSSMDIDRGEEQIFRSPQHESIEFNETTTVCVDSWFMLRCYSKTSSDHLSIWFTNKTGTTFTLASNNGSSVFYTKLKARFEDAGQYFCGNPSLSHKHMFLTVGICSYKTLYLITGVIVLMLGAVFVVSLTSHRCAKIQRRRVFQKKILSFSNAKGMYRNERYIPLISDLNWEINQNNITVSSQLLGAGEFGNVFKGTYGSHEVAIKVAKSEGSERLSQEIEIMKQLGHHRHVIQLIGVCSTKGTVMVILELACGGNLKQHLRDHNPLLKPLCEQIGLEQLLTFVSEIALGMEYLSSQQVIHGDLAARNCLIGSAMCIKLSDFGLTRVAINYEAQGAMAIAWMAPENLAGNTVTSKSDVWSFGVVMWEVFELGACPYPSMTSSEIIGAVRRGAVNSQPSIASDSVYAVMLKCWVTEPNERPSFAELRASLDEVEVNEYL